MMYWLFIDTRTERIAEWPSLESCQSQARSINRQELKWERTENGPQGNAPHWHATGRVRNSITNERNYFMIVEVQ